MNTSGLANHVIRRTLCAVAALFLQQAHATLLFYEPFSTSLWATDGLALKRASAPWNVGAGAGVGMPAVSNAAALSYSGLVTSNGSRGLAMIATTEATVRSVGTGFAEQTSGAVYCSFLINVAEAPTNTRALLFLSSWQGGTAGLTGPNRHDAGQAAVWLNASRQLLVGKRTTATAAAGEDTYGSLAAGVSPALTLGQTYLVVLKNQFNPAAGDDVVSLYLNPAIAGEPGTADSSTATGADSNIRAVWVPQGRTSGGTGEKLGSDSGLISVDEIRVGTTWADVVESDGSSFSAPVITRALVENGNFVLLGTNGPPDGAYQVLCSTKLDASLEDWPVIGIQNFDPNGHFSFTNSVLNGEPEAFYRVLVLSSGPVSAPSITAQPQSLALSVGQTAAFNVTASGTAPLTYRWYFNTNTLLASGASATLTIPNAQVTNSGKISVTVSNLVGITNSVFATLTVTNNTAPPSITSQPATPLNVTVGQTANFSVTATGALPLRYQWYFNTNTPLAGQTNSTLTLSNVQTNQAGKYSVTVTNLYGSTNSVFATLTVSTNSNSVRVPDGYATQNGGTTGGGNATPTIVTTAAAFRSAVNGTMPGVVVVQGRIDLAGSVSIGANKTIMGASTNSGLYNGTIQIRGTNYIIQNLTFGPSSGDVMEISGAKNVFITKCEFYGSTDELCSIVREADWVTVSWSKFHFPSPDSHSFAHLIGNSDSATGDRGKLHVTLHHNWYTKGLEGRIPRVRFGHVHIYNNYINATGTGYCIGIGVECNIRVENVHFDSVANCWADYGGRSNGKIGWAGLKFTSASQPTFMPNTFPVFTPPYPFTLDPVDNVQAIVTAGAGNVLSP